MTFEQQVADALYDGLKKDGATSYPDECVRLLAPRVAAAILEAATEGDSPIYLAEVQSRALKVLRGA